MFGMIEKCECPICGKMYETNPRTCDCGFEGLVFLPAYATDEVRGQYAAQKKEQQFRIFKFAKQVYYGETVYEKSPLSLFDRDGRVDVDEALETRGLALVAPTEKETKGLPTRAIEGLLALRANVRALILHTDEAEYSLLDESRVEVLLLGAAFKRFCHGGLMQYCPLRYLWVDGKNRHLAADDNVIFSKDRTKLHLYARARPGEEYRVPESVKSLEPFSFFSPLYLKRLYLPRGIRISEDAFGHHNAYWQRDGEQVRVGPAFEIIYY